MNSFRKYKEYLEFNGIDDTDLEIGIYTIKKEHMDCGMESGNFGVITDPDFRYEIYEDWKSILSRYPDYDVKRFCKNKGISEENLDKIVEEYKNFKPSIYNEVETRIKISYSTVFCLKSITREVKIQKSSEGKYLVKGKEFETFYEALNSMNEFTLHSYYHIPTFLDGEYSELVKDNLNENLKSLSIEPKDQKWVESWEKALGCKYVRNRKSYQFNNLKPDFKVRLCSEALNKNHKELKNKLEVFGEFLIKAFCPYILLDIDWEKDHQIMKQNKVYSGLLLKYLKVLISWSNKNLKIHSLIYNPGSIETKWLENIEDEIQSNYEFENNIEYPDLIFRVKNKISGSSRFKLDIEELLGRSIYAFENYTYLKELGKSEDEAIYYSGLHNQKHKELAEFFVANYTTKRF